VAAAALANRSVSFPKSARVWQFFGGWGFLVCLYLLTFPGIAKIYWDGTIGTWNLRHSAGVVSMDATGIEHGDMGNPGVAIASCHRHEGRTRASWIRILAAAFDCGSMPGAHAWRVSRRINGSCGVFNLGFLALAVAWMAKGAGKDVTNRGAGLGSAGALVTARFSICSRVWPARIHLSSGRSCA